MQSQQKLLILPTTSCLAVFPGTVPLNSNKQSLIDCQNPTLIKEDFITFPKGKQILKLHAITKQTCWIINVIITVKKSPLSAATSGGF